jgi:hypothetical protein
MIKTSMKLTFLIETLTVLDHVGGGQRALASFSERQLSSLSSHSTSEMAAPNLTASADDDRWQQHGLQCREMNS